MTTAVGVTVVAAFSLIGIARTAAWEDIFRGILEEVQATLDDPQLRNELTGEQIEMIETAQADIDATIADLSFAMGLDPAVAGMLWIVLSIVFLAVVVLAIDAFGSERTEPSELRTDRFAWKAFNLVVGVIVYWILFIIGLVFFVIPGLLFAFFMFFFPAAIALRGESFFSAFSSSAGVVRRNLLSTLGVIVIAIVVSVLLWFVGGFVPGVIGTIIGEVLSAIGMAFVFAMMALAYVDATADSPDDSDESTAEPA